MSFTKGQQPCADYKGSLDGNGHAVWTNEHQCYRCHGIVSFCENCHRDHHKNGYETCTHPCVVCGDKPTWVDGLLCEDCLKDMHEQPPTAATYGMTDNH